MQRRTTGINIEVSVLLLMLWALGTVPGSFAQSKPNPATKPAPNSGSSYLTLSGSEVTDARIRQIISSNPWLRHIKLVDVPNMTDAGLMELGRATGLEEIEIVRANFRGTGLKALRALPNLRVLELEAIGLSDEALKDLSVLKLKHISLRDTQVTDNGAWYLGYVPTLEYIDLSNTGVSDRTIMALKKVPNIRFLYVLNTNVTDAVADVLSNFKTLEVLDLRQTCITDRTVGKLTVLPKLKQFLIGTATVTDSALIGLRGNKTIETLNLCDSMVTDSGFNVLSTLSNLKHVEVYRSHVSSFGVEKLKKVKPGITVSGP